MKSLFLAAIGATVAFAPMAAACEAADTFPLDGTTVTLEGCGEFSDTCIEAERVLYAYGAYDDGDPTVLNVGILSSPWRMYGPERRIITPEELADQLRPLLKPGMDRVELRGSWAGFTPHGRTTSLAEDLSAHLPSVTVAGPEGFIWFGPEGRVRVTRQSYTKLHGALYTAREGDEVMAAAVTFAAPAMREVLPAEHHGDFLLQQGLTEDMFGLCPGNALMAFEQAAALGNVVGAYNAAVMLLERGETGDLQRARALLVRAAEAGDEPSMALLRRAAIPAT